MIIPTVPASQLLASLRGKLIASCQAPEGDPFGDPEGLSRMARAAVRGGAAGIRANGARNIRAIRQAVTEPIIGIDKQVVSDGKVLITPTVEGARELLEAGAGLIALDCTGRGQQFGALDRLASIRWELGAPVLADIATEEEAEAAARAGASMILTTMRGYTDDTAHVMEFDPDFVARLVSRLDTPVVAEGRIETPAQAREAFAAGAFAVIVGSAITRPAHIARRFAEALRMDLPSSCPVHVLAVDLGGTNTKSGVVSNSGQIVAEDSSPTPTGGRAALLDHLKNTVRAGIARARDLGISVSAIGIATAGWVDPRTGCIVYATQNLPGWTGTHVREELEAEFGLPAAVENDANALAHAEKRFGGAANVDNFICITLGTGVGGACYANGKLIQGDHCMANALGHVRIRPGGRPCSCGQEGCLEAYANAAALVRAANDGSLATAQQVIAAAYAGHSGARDAIRECAAYLAEGCASLVHLLDPGLILLSGGLAQGNPLLASGLEESLSHRVIAWERRGLRVKISDLGYYGGVLGAAAIALREAGRPVSTGRAQYICTS
jgi:N-acetylmannosamine-6-phosphate 2-epimerase/N-acetylmannosamine kinase